MEIKNVNKNFLPIFLHSGIWAFIFLFPILFNEQLNWRFYLFNHLLPVTITTIIFYINFFKLVPELLNKKKWIQFLLINSLLVITAMVILINLNEFLRPDYFAGDELKRLNKPLRNRPNSGNSRLYFFILRNLPLLLLAIGISYTIRNSQKARNLERERKAQENEHLKSKIAVLRYQVQPHFFFNTLNNIYSMVDSYPELAKKGIHQLSKLMRYILYKSDNPTARLSEELEFIKSYVNLMKLRFGEHLEIHEDYSINNKEYQIPPLLFIALVENAFKHGVHPTQKSSINIVFFEEGEYIGLRVTNTYFPKKTNDHSGSGIGLDNLRKRLDILYREKEYNFETEVRSANFYAELKIPRSYGEI